MKCKYMIDFVDFKLEADNIPDLVKLYFDNYDRTHNEIYARFEWTGQNYEYMNSDDYNLYTKYWNYYNKKRLMEKDFV